MSLAHDELSLILRLARNRASFVVVDCRKPAEPRIFDVFVRPWYASGALVRSVTIAPHEFESYLGRHELMEPIVITGLPTPTGVVGAYLKGNGEKHIVEIHGRLTFDGDSLHDFDPVESRIGSTTLHIDAAHSRSFSGVNFPVSLEVDLVAQAHRNRFRVSGDNPHGTLPSPRWFLIEGKGKATVRIDVRPAYKDDRWDLSSADSNVRISPASEPGSAVHKIRHLGLVFDCTCPSADCWSLARIRVLGRKRDLSDEERSLKPSQYNQAVRDGLSKGLREAFASQRLPVHLAWFADGEERGLANIEQLPSAGEIIFGDKGTAWSDELGESIASCEYKPGLDLWDPLEDALAIVAEPILRREDSEAGILIVGNSPPNLPLYAHSPLWDLLDLPAKRSTVRRMNHRFTDLLERLRQQGVPVVYLFLTHRRATWDNQDELTAFENLHNRLRRALDEHVKVISVPADEANIVSGVKQAMSYLSQPRFSAVRVLGSRS